MSANPVLDRVVEASGLAPVIAGGVIRRCCTRAGVSVQRLTWHDIPKLLPLLEPLLTLYLEPDECKKRMEALQRLAS